jgi:sigma-E factor negative regulatory protein RseA
MSEQIREQVSAFLDGELPSTETELLLKRLTRDAELRESFGRYALIGEAVRGGNVRLSRGFAARVNGSIDGGTAVAAAAGPRFSAPRWWRPLAGVAVAAGVAAVAIVALQQRSVSPSVPLTAQAVQAPAASKEALSYTVPAAADTGMAAPGMMPAARLTNYVFAHSPYSAMGKSNVLSGLLSVSDDETTGANKVGASPRDSRVAP